MSTQSTTYTITEALQELKLLTKRINRHIDTTIFITTKRSDEKSLQNINDITSEASSSFQSIQDLIKRRAYIKSLIMTSNATTKVDIAGKTYTVCEVIAHKEFIKEQEKLLETLKNQYVQAHEAITRFNSEKQRKIDSLIQTTFGRDSTSKSNIDDIKNITDTYNKQYFIDTIDPLDLKEKIQTLEKEIEEFKNTCDFKLSYINAITTITV